MKPFLLLFFILSSTTLHAAFWKCELPGGSYTVNLSTISSVSSHEYVVDGAARVTEVTINTTGPVVARFYYLEPMIPKAPLGIGQSVIDTAQSRANEVTDRTGVEPVWKKVVKNYPTTTHARTVEYRLDSLEKLETLRKSLEAAWRTNAETSIKIK
jgi:hypothetical protein